MRRLWDRRKFNWDVIVDVGAYGLLAVIVVMAIVDWVL